MADLITQQWEALREKSAERAVKNTLRLENDLRHGTIQKVEGGHRFYPDHDAPEEIDVWRMGGGYHNGPKCAACDDLICEHCNQECYTEPCPEAGRLL